MKKAIIIVGPKEYNSRKNKLEDYLKNNCTKVIPNFTKVNEYGCLEACYVIDSNSNENFKNSYNQKMFKDGILMLDNLKDRMQKLSQTKVSRDVKLENKIIFVNIDKLPDVVKVYAKDGKLISLDRNNYIFYVAQYLGVKNGYVTFGTRVMKINNMPQDREYFVCKICNKCYSEEDRLDKEVTGMPINVCHNCAKRSNLNISYRVVATIKDDEDEYVI